MAVCGGCIVGSCALLILKERHDSELRDLLSQIQQEEIDSKFREDTAKAQREYDEEMAKIEARSQAWKDREAEDKRMKETLSEGEFFQWRVKRNEAESAAAEAAEKRKAIQLQEDQLKELREINTRLGK